MLNWYGFTNDGTALGAVEACSAESARFQFTFMGHDVTRVLCATVAAPSFHDQQFMTKAQVWLRDAVRA